MRYAMIMAGGKGTRLWPMSREGQPKQLIDFIERPGPASGSEQVSLLRIAADRLDPLVPEDRRYICTGEVFREQIRAALPSFTDDRILGEPVGRDTVNAVGFAAAVLGRQDPDAVFCVLTADHIIEPVDVFARAIGIGFDLVEADPSRLVTFGITPTFPATGYGYIRRASAIEGTEGLGFEVERFVEKPDLPTAQAYLDEGVYFWNSGMFVFHAATFMGMLERCAPENHAGLLRIADAWDTAGRAATLAEVYPTLPKISVDYAVMEPASTDPAVTICGVEMKARWLDVGSWPSFAETLDPDERGNRRSGPGGTVFHDCDGCTIATDRSGHTLALLGCTDLIVVHTERATLVMPRARAEDLKALHAGLPASLQ